MLIDRFKIVNRDEYTKSIELAEFATPYPEDEKREFPEKPCDNRNAFIRDRDRILHCVSFRKLLGKTQVFISEKNPMQRNRLTHTMEVWQISVSIARMLKANIHLTEAIAFGHDLGHTPFGHAGEKVLDLLMKDDKLEGFSHNAQSVRVISKLESNPNINPLILGNEIPSWPNSIGLNLTYWTREGIFKHTDRFKEHENGKYKHENLIKEFGNNYGSIEAQIVYISDEIAQCTHDLHDIWMAKIISESQIQDIFNHFPDLLGKKQNSDKQIISGIIGKLTNDVSIESLKKLNEKYFEDSGSEDFITFSKEGKKLTQYIKDYVYSDAILGDEVNTMNSRGRHIIKSLYNMFKDDPFCLPKEIKDKFSDSLQDKLNDQNNYEVTKVSDKNDIRVVCDFIASLTDKQAIDAFHSTLL